MTKINVLFVIVQMKMGGSEHLVWDLIRNLDRTRFRASVAWFYEDEPLQQFVDLGVPLFHVPKVKRFDFSTMRQLAAIIKDNHIDVVNAHHYLSLIYSFWGCKVTNRVGLIYTEHSVWELQAISPKWRATGKVLLRFTDASVGISSKVREGLKTIFQLPDRLTHTISNGVDCSLLSPPDNKEKVKSDHGVKPDDIVVGMVANLKKNKNHIFLLKVFNKLQQVNSHLKLWFIGQGFENDPEGSEDEIRQYINHANLEKKVSLLGSRPDVPDLLKVIDVFCLLSYQEGLPISLIEAMAAGLPVIGTDIEGVREVIHQKENGFLVEVNNKEELEDALHKLVEDPAIRLRFGKKSREMALRNYALEACMEGYQQLFRQFAKSIKKK